MSKLKRDPVKYIRDKIKAQYVKDSECYICGDTENLQFHHIYSVAELYKKWKIKNKIIINTAEDIMEVRDSFLKEHYDKMVNQAFTLCTICHNEKLHKIYGKSPSLGTAKKQSRWINIQRDKRTVNSIQNSLD